ncbi:hypothetical protein AK830_g10286 [Neonectria ditissima]|uniref:Uncharacterized protein n=1 Tax=Neonectria ditissima TaxID=78410 RepID=A0A0N8H5I5_9HYPO|nr:hypothetical protein AK830_g10286 [Neonectria ditissima]
MPAPSSYQVAAACMSAILEKHAIKHAIIGGSAVSFLGHTRRTLDIDVLIDVKNPEETRGRISQLLIDGDSRFSVEHNKLFFTSPQGRIPIETLPIGHIGLPRQLLVIRPGDGTVPVLHPAVLILTKIKRCVHLIHSTRPQSVTKFHSDVSDINFLMKWLVENEKKVDFVGYQSANVDKLYAATKDLVKHWKETGESEGIELMDLVLEHSDREKIMD